jgi:hypothetical protein
MRSNQKVFASGDIAFAVNAAPSATSREHWGGALRIGEIAGRGSRPGHERGCLEAFAFIADLAV